MLNAKKWLPAWTNPPQIPSNKETTTPSKITKTHQHAPNTPSIIMWHHVIICQWEVHLQWWYTQRQHCMCEEAGLTKWWCWLIYFRGMWWFFNHIPLHQSSQSVYDKIAAHPMGGWTLDTTIPSCEIDGIWQEPAIQLCIKSGETAILLAYNGETWGLKWIYVISLKNQTQPSLSLIASCASWILSKSHPTTTHAKSIQWRANYLHHILSHSSNVSLVITWTEVAIGSLMPNHYQLSFVLVHLFLVVYVAFCDTM